MSHNLESYQESNSFVGRLRSRDLSIGSGTGSRSRSQVSAAKEALLEASAVDSLLKYTDDDDKDINSGDRSVSITEKMWTKDYIGLYAHYAGVGIAGGIQGLLLNFCVYYFNGATSLCPNAQSIVFLPWSFKIVYGILTDCYRPFGLRRYPYIIAGWIGVLITTFVLALSASKIGSSGWILLSVATNVFLMLADVPADGYSVELGQMEAPEKRGQILATGQRIRFSFTMLAGMIQAFMVNGPTTNPEGCPIDAQDCWSWGLTVQNYYWLIFAILLVLFIPICFLKEPDASHIPMRSFNEHRLELWETMQNSTTLYLLIYVSGSQIFTSMINISSVYMQYYVIGLTNLQSGINSIANYLALVIAIMIFQTYLINRDWRLTQYLSSLFTGILGLQWLLVFYNTGGLQNAWFTIFINTNQLFSQGITQVLFAMAVIELAKPGQESTTYELIVSAANAGSTLNTIIATQFLQFTNAAACDSQPCPSNSVDLTDQSTYESSNGPTKFRNYTFLILAINIVGMLVFTPFLPKQKEQCHEWRIRGEKSGHSRKIGYASLIIATTTISYGILCSVMLVNEKTSCLKAFGGSGCSNTGDDGGSDTVA